MNVEILERATNAFKNLCQIVVFLGIIIILSLLVFSQHERELFRGFVDELGVESLGAAGVEVKFKELKNETLKLVNAKVEEQKPIPQDTAPPSDLSKVLTLVDETFAGIPNSILVVVIEIFFAACEGDQRHQTVSRVSDKTSRGNGWFCETGIGPLTRTCGKRVCIRD